MKVKKKNPALAQLVRARDCSFLQLISVGNTYNK